MMNRFLCLAFLFGFFFTACDTGGDTAADDAAAVDTTAAAAPPMAEGDLTIVAGERVGAVTAQSSPDDVRNVYGSENVRDTSVYIGEGFSRPGMIVYPDSPNRIEIVWTETEPLRPEIVYIREPGAEWRTESGVSIGTTLQELVRLNGGDFELSGFDWDYGGTVTDWKGGNLDRINLRLGYTEGQEIPRELAGDQIISSNHPGFEGLDVRVEQIHVILNRPTE